MQFMLVGSILAAIGVALGAFGAHGLKNIVEPNLIATWETAARYHITHAMALIMIGVIMETVGTRWGGAITVSGGLMLAGIIFFSGSLYLLVVTGITKFGAVAPIGGLFLIAAWLTLAYAVVQAR